MKLVWLLALALAPSLAAPSEDSAVQVVVGVPDFEDDNTILGASVVEPQDALAPPGAEAGACPCKQILISSLGQAQHVQPGKKMLVFMYGCY